MGFIKRHRNLAFGAFLALALLLFSYYFIRPQFELIQHYNSTISEKRARLSARDRNLANRPTMLQKTGQLQLQLKMLGKGYFIPFLQENILNQVNSLMNRAGLRMLTMNFSVPERVSFEESGEQTVQQPSVSFGQVLKGLKTPEEDLEPGGKPADRIRQYLQQAYELIGEGETDIAPGELPEINYDISRTSLSIVFQTDSSDKLIQFLNSSEEALPRILISSLECSRDQTGWTGTMVLHFYVLPEFPRTEGD